MITLNVSVRGSSAPTRTNDGHCFGPRSGCSARNALNFSASNSAPSVSTNAAITWSPTSGAGIPYTATSTHVGMAQQHPFDRRRAEVLAVDTHPVAEPAREVGIAVLVAVGQVAAVVHAATHPLGLGIGVVVIALETSCVRDVHQFTGHARRARLAGLHVDDLGARRQWAQRSGRGVRCAADRNAALRRPESVHHHGVEPAGEPLDVGGCALVAVDGPQRVVASSGRSGVAST